MRVVAPNTESVDDAIVLSSTDFCREYGEETSFPRLLTRFFFSEWAETHMRVVAPNTESVDDATVLSSTDFCREYGEETSFPRLLTRLFSNGRRHICESSLQTQSL
jgi:predicted metal-binding protein